MAEANVQGEDVNLLEPRGLSLDVRDPASDTGKIEYKLDITLGN